MPLAQPNEAQQRAIMTHIFGIERTTEKYDLPVEPVLKSASFPQRPGSHDKHHACSGGLLVHTGEVLEYCRDIAALRNIDQRVLFTAAIWHDFMKIRDYNGEGEKTPYRNLVRHVVGSYAEWVKYAETLALDQPFVDAVGHCILAHHGRQEWGSPVEPQTEEALILHQADLWSAQWGPGR